MTDLLIDTDTASDDAVALILAMRSREHVVRGITCVAGNVHVTQAARNACLCVELCGVDVPVYRGCDRPLIRPWCDASWFHGSDGLSDLGYAPRQRNASSMHAVDALLNLSRKHAGATLVTLGPLTNVAVALSRDEDFENRIARCVVMGGNPCCVGNVTPAAEYNIWCDPEAAEIVFASGMNIEMVGWHLSRGAAVWNAAEIDRARVLNTPLARFAIDSNRTAAEGYRTQTGEAGISLPDPIAMAVALEPALVTSASSHPVRIECASELTRGMTVVDELGVGADERNRWRARRACRIVWTMDVDGFKRRLGEALAG